jgi:hypothetical protein
MLPLAIKRPSTRAAALSSQAASEFLTFQKITLREFSFPDGFPADAADLVNRLLMLEPQERLGAADMAALRQHR